MCALGFLGSVILELREAIPLWGYISTRGKITTATQLNTAFGWNLAMLRFRILVVAFYYQMFLYFLSPVTALNC